MVPRPTNFADPAFEPTDEELQQLSHEAFAGVAAQRRVAEVLMHARIAELRAETLARFRPLFARVRRSRENAAQ
jgi:hypothetical protein